MQKRRPGTLAHARRKLASINAQIAAWRATDCTGDWRLSCDKARALASLEVQEARWQSVLAPRMERYLLPF